jgi:hypothetical protein
MLQFPQKRRFTSMPMRARGICTRRRELIVSQQPPLRSTATIAAAPAMSLIPFAPLLSVIRSLFPTFPNNY